MGIDEYGAVRITNVPRILTRTPLRITLGGGGTDLPSFYEAHGGFVFAMAIHSVVQVSLCRRPPSVRCSWMEVGETDFPATVDEIRHAATREAFRRMNVHESIELKSRSDLPFGTGLGSSGAYLVGLLAALHEVQQKPYSPQKLAEEACHIEMNVLKWPVGKQDPYLAAFGGFQALTLSREGGVHVESVSVNSVTAMELATKARLYDTGVRRSARNILHAQDVAARESHAPDHGRVVDALCRIKELGRVVEQAIRRGDVDRFGQGMDEHWALKKSLSSCVGLASFDPIYEHVKREYGVLGGKIVGAGGGGFVLLYCPSQAQALDEFMAAQGFPRVPYEPSPHGVQVVDDGMAE